jgi:CelD/BcsL family acetyltransferase involved in cellulose biosynthesis
MYGERGPVVLEAATTTPDALELFERLVSMNLARRRHEQSVFASERWVSFHRTLITRAFPIGGVQLLEVRAGHDAIGILYNFVDRGTIASYQSAFAFEADNRLKPGHVTHVLAIEAALREGFDVYDFLAADGPQGSRYKASMSTSTGRLAWAVIRRRTLPGLIVAAARRARARLR